MSIWSSLDLPEPIRDLDGSDVDVAVTRMHPERDVAIRITCDMDEIHLSAAHAARLRDTLARALDELKSSVTQPR